MSNLSELLPAGGAAKEFEPVASGTLPNGTAVVLKADGTVEAINPTSGGPSAGTPVVYGGDPSIQSAVFDSNSNKVVIAYRDTDDSAKGKAVVGTVSGTSISFGTVVVFHATNSAAITSTFDSNSNKVVICWTDIATGLYLNAIVGTVSGTSISFGTRVVFRSVFSLGYKSSMTFDSNTNKVVIAYYVQGATGEVIIGTVSGTSISFGTPVVFNSATTTNIAAVFDSNSNKIVLSYLDTTSTTCKSIVGTVSGTSISFGSNVVFHSGGVSGPLDSVFDSNSNKVVILYTNITGQAGTAIVGTVSGTSISFGTAAVFSPNGNSDAYVTGAFDSSANKVVIAYKDYSNSSYGTAVVATLSGTSISFSTPVVYETGVIIDNAVTFDPIANKTVVFYGDDGNSGFGTAAVINSQGSNLTSTNFVGITAEAIADTATGKVNPKGGVASSVANIAPTMSFGSEYVFNAGTSIYTSMAFDPNNANKFVAVYRDTSNSNYGTAIVGTVSGNSISYGPEVVFYSGQTAYTSIAFDPNTSGMFVVSYMDVTGGGSACAGTVSGTNITFGTAVVFETSEANYSTIAFDPSTAGKFIITYLIGISTGNAIVGTVSGTSITFGTTVVFEAAKAEFPSVSFDPNDSGKFVIAYNDGGNSDYGTAIAGTISGTTPSFGSAAVFDSVACSRTNVSFDPNTAGKFVVAYRGGSEHGNAVVGTVSGTSLSFGSNVVFNNTVTSEMAISFDSGTGGKFVIAYQDDVNSEYGTAILGVLSGTSVSFSLKTVFNTGDTLYPSIAFDPNTAGEFVVTYRDVDNSNYGTSVVGNISNALTIGSDYYVQADGSVSTATSSPAINIGRAISPTSLILR